MQDLIKQNVVPSNPYTKQPKWLNKDRFWNFVFWFGMSFGLAVTLNVSRELQAKYSLGTVLIWTTLIGIPLLVRHFSKTTFIKKDTFANSEGVMISKKQMPYSFPLAAISGLGIAFVVAETFLPKGHTNFVISFVTFVSLFSGISLYFIYKNCPISILFNRKFYRLDTVDITPTKSRLFDHSDDSSSRSRDDDYKRRNSPSYSHYSYNAYHRPHR